jgi:hypothetical protein
MLGIIIIHVQKLNLLLPKHYQMMPLELDKNQLNQTESTKYFLLKTKH